MQYIIQYLKTESGTKMFTTTNRFKTLDDARQEYKNYMNKNYFHVILYEINLINNHHIGIAEFELNKMKLDLELSCIKLGLL